jgi:hypothetical protein
MSVVVAAAGSLYFIADVGYYRRDACRLLLLDSLLSLLSLIADVDALLT